MAYDAQAAVAALSRADAVLAELIREVGPCTMSSRTSEQAVDPFQHLLRAIVYQQLSGKAAATIHSRVLALLADGPTPQAVLATSAERLRGAGLSRAKTAAAKDLAAKTLEGIVPSSAELQRLDDEAIVQRLTAVRGIGRWTVEMLLMFHLERPDVLPLDDLGVRKGFMLAYGHPELPSRPALRAHGERWRPYRSVASWYLWRAVERWS